MFELFSDIIIIRTKCTVKSWKSCKVQMNAVTIKTPTLKRVIAPIRGYVK